MAKAQEEPVTADQVPAVAADPAPLEAVVIFRDKLYTSRTLILPEDGRPISVKKGHVLVPASDARALAYLKGRDDFEPLRE